MRFYFHTDQRRSRIDLDGEELPSIAVARVEAVKLLAELLLEAPEEFWTTAAFDLTVTDDSGLILCALSVAGIMSPAASKLSR